MGETAKVLTIRLRVQDDGSVVLERGAKGIDKLGNEAKEASRDLETLDSRLSSIKGAVIGVLGSLGVAAIARAGAELLRTGVAFNAQMESSQLSIAALVSSLGEIKNEHGDILRGQERWNASLQLSTQLQQAAKTAALETKAEYKDIIRLLQEGLGPMLQAGVTDTAKIIDMVKLVAQTGGALGIPGERLGQEIKALFRGEKGPDNQIANALLGDISKEKFDQLREAGKLYDFLSERMASFAKAGEESTKTFDVALSNLKDSLNQALGEGTQELTRTLSAALGDVTDQFFSVDAAGHRAFDPNLIAAIKTVAGAAADSVETLAAMVGWLKEIAATYNELNNPTISTDDLKTKLQSDLAYLENAKKQMQMAGASLLPDERRQYEGAIARWQALVDQDRKMLEERRATTATDKPQWVASQFLQQVAGKAQLQYFPDEAAAGQQLIDMSSKDGERYLAVVRQLTEAAKDGVLTQLEFAAAIQKVNREFASGPKLSGRDHAADETNKAQKRALEKFLEAGELRGHKEFRENTLSMFDEVAAKSVATMQQEIDNGKTRRDMLIRYQREAEDGRIAVIEDAIERELAERLAANQREFEDVEEKYRGQAVVIELAAKIRLAKDTEAFRNAERLRKLDEVGTREWASKVRQTVLQQVGDLPRLMTNAAVSSRLAMSGAVEGFLDDIVDGQADAILALEDLFRQLGKVAAHELSGILTNGESVTAQLKEMWDKLNATGKNSKLDAGLAGAGFGAMVGGVFQGPNNYASQGGAIGGMLGAIVGTLAGNTAIGAVIGSAIGTAIGSSIQKGEDEIQVAIRNVTLAAMGNSRTVDIGPAGNYTNEEFENGGAIEVSEKGISAERRREIAIQIRRRVREEMKGWQAILDLLPQELQDRLAEMKIPTTLNLTGGVEGGDLRDESALQSLQDFLGKKLPAATFAAYKGAVEAALGLLGTQSGQIQKLFAYWGTLQGNELQDAVQRYFAVVIDAADIRGKIGGDRTWRQQEAVGRLDKTPLGGLRDTNSQIALGVASMSLTDIDDLIAAQERLNTLGRQYFDQSESALEGLIAMQRQLHEQNQSLVEQVKLAGMGDQEKMDYFYGQLSSLREQLQRETDPRKIAEIEGRMNAYIQSALGLDPDNKDNRDRLLAILGDIEKIRDSRIGQIHGDIANEDIKAATMLQDAATKLLGVAEALKPEPEPNEPPETGGPPPTERPKPIESPQAPVPLPGPKPEPLPAIVISDLTDAMRHNTAEIRHMFDWAGGEGLKLDAKLHLSVEVTGTDGLVDVTVQRTIPEVIKFIQRNRDSIESNTRG